MTPVFSARRRADDFAALVEGNPTSGSTGMRDADLLTVVELLREVPEVNPRPSFVANLRDRLMLAAGTALVPSTPERLTLPLSPRARDRRIAAAFGGFALVGATTSLAMAAQSALPGDVLYPMKRAIENVQTGVTVGEGQKGQALLANAYGRLDEVGALSRAGNLKDAPAIASTLNVFVEQATEASDLLLADYSSTGHESSIAQLRDFTGVSLGELTTLEPVVPSEARDELLNAARVLFQIDAAARVACATCGGAGIGVIPNVFVPMSADLPVLGDPAGGAEQPIKKKKGTSSEQPALPDVTAGNLPPGSVSSGTGGSGDSSGEASGSDSRSAVKRLTDGLGSGSQPTSTPPVPTVDGLLGGVGKTVDDVTSELNP
ncbi:DUF5667 domain-containing protein [Nocardioides sp.]|uniref:DUF5667 domain-containing protein n=1 Tax=Nocardioides sp. TaxID=35761 RepID=UPI0035629327